VSIDHIQCGEIDRDRSADPIPGANLGVYSIAFVNEPNQDHEALLCMTSLLQRGRGNARARRGSLSGNTSEPHRAESGAVKRKQVMAFGGDYATQDGTCVRE
jgi:hypothetical protein